MNLGPVTGNGFMIGPVTINSLPPDMKRYLFSFLDPLSAQRSVRVFKGMVISIVDVQRHEQNRQIHALLKRVLEKFSPEQRATKQILCKRIGMHLLDDYAKAKVTTLGKLGEVMTRLQGFCRALMRGLSIKELQNLKEETRQNTLPLHFEGLVDSILSEYAALSKREEDANLLHPTSLVRSAALWEVFNVYISKEYDLAEAQRCANSIPEVSTRTEALCMVSKQLIRNTQIY